MSLIFLLGCAAVAPPPGGPVDITSPSLVSINPPSGTTQISGGLTIQLVFSERLEESSLEKGIQLLPVIQAPIELKIKKETIIVKLPENLAHDQTYLLTLSRDLLDEHRNRLDRVYQLAFSTGDKISKGMITGIVYDSPEKSSLVYLYQKSEDQNDSLFLKQPDYVTETDDEGRYSFSYLQPGKYQVIAFTGGRPPFPVVPSRMSYGINWKSSITIMTDDTVSNINMRIFKEVPPFRLISVQMENHAQGLLRFTNPFFLSPENPPSIHFSLEGDSIILPDIIYQYKKNSNEIRFQTSDLISGMNATVHISGLRDSTDQKLEPTSREIQIPEKDSITISLIYPYAGEIITLFSNDMSVTFQFSGAVLYDEDSLIVALTDTGGTALPVEKVWDNPTRFTLIPGLDLDPDKQYKLTLFANRLFSIDSISLADSLFTYPIQIKSDRGAGNIFGNVTGKYVSGSIVEAKSIEKPIVSHTSVVNLKGKFELKELKEGKWLLSAYQDMDRNTRYTPGRAIPFVPSEPFLMTRDTVEVRANWDVIGVELTYPDEE